jgi:hypothetical protein
MIALKLVRLIETHSEQLAHSLMYKVDECTKCAEFKKLVARQEQENRALEIYQNLSDWLLNKTEHDLFTTYTAIGKRRFEQGVPFHQLIWALLLSKQNLWDFIEHEVVEESAMLLRGEFELLRLLDQFYERSLYYAALGYWEANEFTEREQRLVTAAS